GGFAINGASADDLSGRSVSSAGDVNGDGLDDLIIGAAWADPNGQDTAGASYVVFGRTDSGTVELSSLGAGGFVINGITDGDSSGYSVSSAGDVNGDGFDDLIIGAPYADPNGQNMAGASYVIYGGNFTNAVTQVGTTGNDTLIGTSANDVIFAGLGNDFLDGMGGTDRLSGGAGADRFIMRDLEGTTTVIDFDGAEGDRLDVASFWFADYAAFQSAVTITPEGPGGHDTRIQLDADTAVILEDVKPAELDPSHVMLAFI
ncbi:MAG: hypothetical protein ACK5IB_07970, partial [Qingshengfaniella sp.]